MKTPKLYLSVDNCFAIKRWITPKQWMSVIKDLGASSIEASTDNEFDPLFSPSSYIDDWISEVQTLEKTMDMKVRSFFTGYQTYRTTGLAHPDERMRTKLKNEWFKPLIKQAGKIHADIGFSFHALQEQYLQDPQQFQLASDLIIQDYAELAEYANAHNNVKLCCEQMYAPYQTPWTIKGARELMEKVFSKSNKPFYIAIDVGHMVGQRIYKKPSSEDILQAISAIRNNENSHNLWLGPLHAYDELHHYATSKKQNEDIAFTQSFLTYLDSYNYMFAEEQDGNPYAWLEELGAYSPIIHMQQTNGIKSSHAPFTKETNKDGIITGVKLLESLAKSYEKEQPNNLPQKSDTINLAFEIFIPNVQFPYYALKDLKETVKYWKQFIPYDGITLDEAIKRLNQR